MNRSHREGKTWTLYRKHWRINDKKEVEVRCCWISQKLISTGIWGLGWGAEGKETADTEHCPGRYTCNLSSGRSVRNLEGRKNSCRWGTYCSTLLLMLFKVVFLISLPLRLFCRQCISKALKQERYPIFPMQTLSSIPSLQQFASRQ